MADTSITCADVHCDLECTYSSLTVTQTVERNLGDHGERVIVSVDMFCSLDCLFAWAHRQMERDEEVLT